MLDWYTIPYDQRAYTSTINEKTECSIKIELSSIQQKINNKKIICFFCIEILLAFRTVLIWITFVDANAFKLCVSKKREHFVRKLSLRKPSHIDTELPIYPLNEYQIFWIQVSRVYGFYIESSILSILCRLK